MFALNNFSQLLLSSKMSSALDFQNIINRQKNRGQFDFPLKLDTPCAAGARSTSFPPAVPPEEVYLKQCFSLIRSRTSVQRLLVWCPNSHLVRSIMSMLRFWKVSSKSCKIRVRKRSLNQWIVLVSFINSDPFSDHSKSKVQTTSRQEPCHSSQIPFAKINYFLNEERTSVFLHYRMERALRAIM